MQFCVQSESTEFVMMVDSPHPLVAAERITLEFLHLETTSEPFPMLIDKLK